MRSVTCRKSYLWLFLVVLFLLQNRLQQSYNVFQYLDEIFALLVIPLLIVNLLQKKKKIIWDRSNILLAICLLIFWMFGWAGFFKYHYQPFTNAFKDAFVNIKFFLALGTSFLMFDDEKIDFESFKDKIWPVLNVITIVLFVLCLADLSFGIFSTETRGGMRAVKLFYSAYTFLVAQCVFLSAVYLWFYENKRKQIMLPLLMLAFIMLSTRRAKAMGIVACILLIYLFVFYHKRKKMSKKIIVMTSVVLGFAVAGGIYQLVSYYYTMGVESARAVLTIGAPFVAADHFPFGSGWGTYGSTFSAEPYSPVYGMYRMAGVWGMSPDFHDFLSDTFWPMLLGQCGYFGFVAYLGAAFVLIKKIFTLKTDKSTFASVLVPVLYLFISSTSESAFVNPMSIPLAFWIGFLFAQYKVGNETKQEMIL